MLPRADSNVFRDRGEGFARSMSGGGVGAGDDTEIVGRLAEFTARDGIGCLGLKGERECG